MAQTTAKIRLFVQAGLSVWADVACSCNKAHSLAGVTRVLSGDAVSVCNGNGGKRRAAITNTATIAALSLWPTALKLWPARGQV